MKTTAYDSLRNGKNDGCLNDTDLRVVWTMTLFIVTHRTPRVYKILRVCKHVIRYSIDDHTIVNRRVTLLTCLCNMPKRRLLGPTVLSDNNDVTNELLEFRVNALFSRRTLGLCVAVRTLNQGNRNVIFAGLLALGIYTRPLRVTVNICAITQRIMTILRSSTQMLRSLLQVRSSARKLSRQDIVTARLTTIDDRRFTVTIDIISRAIITVSVRTCVRSATAVTGSKVTNVRTSYKIGTIPICLMTRAVSTKLGINERNRQQRVRYVTTLPKRLYPDAILAIIVIIATVRERDRRFALSERNRIVISRDVRLTIIILIRRRVSIRPIAFVCGNNYRLLTNSYVSARSARICVRNVKNVKDIRCLFTVNKDNGLSTVSATITTYVRLQLIRIRNVMSVSGLKYQVIVSFGVIGMTSDVKNMIIKQLAIKRRRRTVSVSATVTLSKRCRVSPLINYSVNDQRNPRLLNLKQLHQAINAFTGTRRRSATAVKAISRRIRMLRL